MPLEEKKIKMKEKGIERINLPHIFSILCFSYVMWGKKKLSCEIWFLESTFDLRY
jgi:hypothetical protein